jgi:tRNA(Arg) A34 adenosine deaminase TadA
MLVGANGQTLYEDHNRVTDERSDAARRVGRHPLGLAPVQRIRTTLYTSCEHCPMCAATHAWAGLGRIVYATSNVQLTDWLINWDVPAPPVVMLPVRAVAPRAVIDGPAPELEEEIKALYEVRYRR